MSENIVLDRNKWEPITLKELEMMTEQEQSQLLSCAWKYDDYREGVIGVSDVKITKTTNHNDKSCYMIEWSLPDGYTWNILTLTKRKKLHYVGGTQVRWYCGLYKRKS